MSKVAKKVKSKKASPRETDNFYFLKILVYFLIGTLWIKLNGVVVFPIGLVMGILLAQHDKFAIDRKIEYALLLVAALLNLAVGGFFISFWT